jgi:ABC-type multidrug transport system fused ATPase/permease subunit
MSFILLIVLFAILGVGLGLLFNKFVIKDYPEKGRKFKYVITVIVFFLITVALFAVIYGKFIVDASVKKSLSELKEDIIKKHSNLPLVRNGIDITAIQNDASTINNTIAALLPSAKELGIPSLVYNAVLNSVLRELHKKLAVIKVAENKDNPFIENNRLTVSSLINGLQTNILKVVKTTVIVFVVIFVILLAIYVLVSLSKASKEKERIAGNNAG